MSDGAPTRVRRGSTRVRTPTREHAASRERQTAGVPPEILRQVKLLELRTRGLVNSLFSGEYHSVFKGQGIEFVEVREYLPGDDVRTIDWNVSARTGGTTCSMRSEKRSVPTRSLLRIADIARTALSSVASSLLKRATVPKRSEPERSTASITVSSRSSM